LASADTGILAGNTMSSFIYIKGNHYDLNKLFLTIDLEWNVPKQ
jgi:hypothetical protein